MCYPGTILKINEKVRYEIPIIPEYATIYINKEDK